MPTLINLIKIYISYPPPFSLARSYHTNQPNLKMSVSTLFAPLPLVPGPSSHYQPMVAPLATNIYSLEDLVKDIKSYLGTSSGIGCDNIDSEYLISLVERYKSNPNDWARYYYNCPGKNYTRNAIENINHKANIVSETYNTTSLNPWLIDSAAVGLEPRQRLTHPRPCQRPLHHESVGWRAHRDCLPPTNHPRRRCQSA